MPLSRLRLRLSAAFALTFAFGLAALNVTLFVLIRRDADRQLTHRLREAATAVAEAVALEFGEAQTAGLAGAARETFHEWPATPYAFIIYDSAGAPLASHGPPPSIAAAPRSWRTEDPAILDRTAGAENDVRLVADRPSESRPAPFHVLAIGTREPTEEHVASLGWWMAASAPLVIVLSLAGGYVLARQALRPIGTLEQALARLDPRALGHRLPVGARPDEVDRLALRFNDLLGRLEEAQQRNRQFVQRAAHQLKTPLTVVLGEADLSLTDAGDSATRQPGMRRVRAAAHQMRRRVDELLLLAEVQTGEPVPLEDLVELDGLAFECADLMRGRAAQTRHGLTLGEVEAVTVRGSDRLLREALVELIENACRYGATTSDIRVSVSTDAGVPWVAVASGGAPLPAALVEAEPGEDGAHLGLAIVRWVADQHRGRLRYAHRDGTNVFRFNIPS